MAVERLRDVRAADGPAGITIVVAADVEERRVERVGEKGQVVGLEVAAAEHGVDWAEVGPIALEVEGWRLLVRDGQEARARAGFRRCGRAGQLDAQTPDHSRSGSGAVLSGSARSWA